jgi:hypothetical protein
MSPTDEQLDKILAISMDEADYFEPPQMWGHDTALGTRQELRDEIREILNGTEASSQDQGGR